MVYHGRKLPMTNRGVVERLQGPCYWQTVVREVVTPFLYTCQISYCNVFCRMF